MKILKTGKEPLPHYEARTKSLRTEPYAKRIIAGFEISENPLDYIDMLEKLFSSTNFGIPSIMSNIFNPSAVMPIIANKVSIDEVMPDEYSKILAEFADRANIIPKSYIYTNIHSTGQGTHKTFFECNGKTPRDIIKLNCSDAKVFEVYKTICCFNDAKPNTKKCESFHSMQRLSSASENMWNIYLQDLRDTTKNGFALRYTRPTLLHIPVGIDNIKGSILLSYFSIPKIPEDIGKKIPEDKKNEDNVGVIQILYPHISHLSNSKINSHSDMLTSEKRIQCPSCQTHTKRKPWTKAELKEIETALETRVREILEGLSSQLN